MRIKRNPGSIEFAFDPSDYGKYSRARIQAFIRAMKKEIPSSGRFWIAEKKVWVILRRHEKTLMRLYDAFFKKQQGKL